MAFPENGVIVDAVLDGIGDARQTYADWTRNGGYFAWAPEYLLTVSVANALWEICGPISVWPEYRLSDALRDAGIPADHAMPVRLEGNRRADLVISGMDSRPHTIVEIKRNVDGWGRIAADVDRLRSMMAAPSSSLMRGIVAFSCTLIRNSRGTAILHDRLSRMAEAAEELSRPGWRCRLRFNPIQWDGLEYWSAAAVILERNTQARAYSACA